MRWLLTLKTKKPLSLLQENGWESGAGSQRPFWKWKKPGFLWLHATKIPTGFQMINFRKLYKNQRPFSNFLRNQKGRCSIFGCIWLIQFKRCIVTCLHLWNYKKSCSHFTFDFQTNLSWFLLNLLKKYFRCNLFQVASKVLNKHGSPCWTRTNDTRINSPSLYRLS